MRHAAKHPTGAVFTSFKAKGADADPLTLIDFRFAVWPVAAPDQRVEFTGGHYGYDTSIASTDLSRFADGTELAWAAQASDGLDTSAWSKPCYLKLDRTPPVAPAVGSRLYPEGSVPSGGEGVKGKFRFDAQGPPTSPSSSTGRTRAATGGFPRAGTGPLSSSTRRPSGVHSRCT